MATIGVCEDDDALRGILRAALEREGHTVRATASGADAVRAFSERVPDALILDIGLPDADGRDVCQSLRARGITAPVLFLTARDGLQDRLSGFHAGGDDYLSKPFSIAELIVRLDALIRRASRSPAAAPPNIGLGGLLDPATHSLNGAGGPVSLTPTEYRLLAAVLARQGAVVRRAELVRVAWTDGASVADNTLDGFISRLRGKLRQAGRPEQLANVRGVGYRLESR
jgi:two-component system, OmpR family, response regulator